jgi:Flp pilus assembly protein protease CpaA
MILETLSNIPIYFIIPHLIALIVLVIGSYTDLRTREVPDWINLGLIGVGFGINLIFTISYWEINFIFASISGFAIFFALAWVMFYAGQWGGGDSKMLMGLGAVIGIDFIAREYFLFNFVLNVVIAGALYGLIWSGYLIARNKKKFSKMFIKDLNAQKNKIYKRYIFVVFLLLLLISIFSGETILRLLALYLAIIGVLTFYLIIAAKSVEKSCMLKSVLPKDLTEGDWIAKNIIVNGKYLTGPKDLGIELKKIKKLVKLYRVGKVKRILIKEGIPFVPSFLIAYIITLFFGNVLQHLI